MTGDTNDQVDVQTEIARIWSELALVHARLEASEGSREHGRFVTTGELNRLMDGVTVATRVAEDVLMAYRRLYLVAVPIRESLSRECDHVVYTGDIETADNLRAELWDAETAMGDFLWAADEDEGETNHD